MRHVLVAYGTVLVVLLAVARRYETAGPDGVDALDLGTALVDAVLVLAVAAGLLLAGRLGLERWALSMARWRRERALAQEELPDAEVIGVTSWRRDTPAPPPPPVAVEPASRPAPTASAGFTYVGPSYAREAPVAPPFPDRRGRRI
jgi:hypothetical protein